MKMVGLAGLMLIAVGCASHPAPTDQIASSVAAVRAAEEAGARDVPNAALHVKLAEEQVNQAKRLMDDGDNQMAEDRAVRAYQDAELALAIAREHKMQRELKEFAENQSQGSGGESQPMNMPAQPMNTPTQPIKTPAQPINTPAQPINTPAQTGTQISPR